MQGGAVLKDFETRYPLSKKILRLIGKAVGDYNMIRPGDNVMIGLSGGKDSLLLSLSLAFLRVKSPVKFNLSASLIDHSNGELDVSKIKCFMKDLNIPLEIIPHPTFQIIKEREERSPCSLCANLRRGILAGAANEKKCNVLALGHNKDDAVETVMLNLFYTGQFKCFHPNLYMSRTNIRTIRPLIYVEENNLNCEALRLSLPVINTECEYAESSKRKSTKEVISLLEKMTPDIKGNIIHALQNFKSDNIWNDISSS